MKTGHENGHSVTRIGHGGTRIGHSGTRIGHDGRVALECNIIISSCTNKRKRDPAKSILSMEKHSIHAEHKL